MVDLHELNQVTLAIAAAVPNLVPFPWYLVCGYQLGFSSIPVGKVHQSGFLFSWQGHHVTSGGLRALSVPLCPNRVCKDLNH